MCSFRFWICLTALASLSASGTPLATAGVMLSDVEAFDQSTNSLGNATAVHGVLDGNDAKGNGDPLLTLLNSGGDAVLVDPNIGDIEISSGGMFSTLNSVDNVDDIVDLIDGSVVDPNTGSWSFLGKSDDNNLNPFDSASSDKSGTIELSNALFGDVVISLKNGPVYQVYAFADLVGVKSFNFSGLEFGLSHAALYFSPGNTPEPGPGTVPEPGTFAIFGLGALGLGVVQFRRRRAAAAPAQ